LRARLLRHVVMPVRHRRAFRHRAGPGPDRQHDQGDRGAADYSGQARDDIRRQCARAAQAAAALKRALALGSREARMPSRRGCPQGVRRRGYYPRTIFALNGERREHVRLHVAELFGRMDRRDKRDMVAPGPNHA
jgi:hypothetical protein